MKKWMLVLLAVLVVMLPAWAMAETNVVDLSTYTTGGSIKLQDGYTYTGTVPANQTIDLAYPIISPESMSITLKEVQLGEGAALYIAESSACNLTITLEGENELKGTNDYPAISAIGGLTIQGNGTLTAIDPAYTNSIPAYPNLIEVESGDLTIAGSAKVEAHSSKNCIVVKNGDMTVRDSARVEAATSGTSAVAIRVNDKNLTIQDSAKVFANQDSDGNHGVYVENGCVTIKDSAEVIATGGSYGIHAAYDLTIQDSAEVTATSTIAFAGIDVWQGNLTITGPAKVTAQATGSGTGIAVEQKNLTITGSAKVTAQGGKNGDGIACQNGQMTIKTTGDGYVKAYGGDADTDVQIYENGNGLSAGNAITLSGNVTAKSGDNENGTMAEGIRSNHGTITILPGSRIEATGNKQRGIVDYDYSIIIQYSKPEDLFVKTGLTKENAVEKTNWNALGSTQTNVTFEQEEVYVLIDTTEKALPPAPPVPPADASGSLPQTGDSANLALWAVLMAASAACAVMVSRKLRKQH